MQQGSIVVTKVTQETANSVRVPTYQQRYWARLSV